ncbi:MAG: hypothetical protein HOA19_03590, partial [Candidatus Marinimicrobia bacterium]|nr:hypothetical protein [Candidatus Neomarinimicrobiota bacterium]MBT5115968.1 hypothetical protein [Candidatus Neomarinimicrobiota bacterium]MBT5748630.1 hypothetical protein [Candidatus Neomarinimicrobiota bacterium]MBT6797071.1 hypothetical protein [Candidatus Neomarinimicrobiota bacterium]MBT6866415.1 hypothetical protein [Candidatus Neomarinimicrobiota bacterium]
MFNNFIKFVALVFLSITFSFAISDRDNPRKAGKEKPARIQSQKDIERDERRSDDKLRDHSAKDGDNVSRVNELKDGRLSIENLFSD